LAVDTCLNNVYQGIHVHDNTELGVPEIIDVYQGIHVHDNTELGVPEIIDVYQGIHVHDNADPCSVCHEHVYLDKHLWFQRVFGS
jgi:hypothetical protein